MDEATVAQIRANPKFQQLVRRRSGFGWTLTVIMLLIYFSYIFAVAFTPATLAEPLFKGAATSLAMPLGVIVILAAIILTAIYVWRANGEFDRLTREITSDVR